MISSLLSSISVLILPSLLLFFILLPFLCLSSRKKSSQNTKKAPLPPGSMGYPYVGETFQLYSNNPNSFFALKQKNYGPIFKTHILGCPCIMVSSPAAAKFVLLTKSHLFKPTFPASKEKMLGPQAIFFQQGDYHAKLRKLVLRAFMPESMRSRVPYIEEVALRALGSWDGQFINTFQEMKTYAFNVALVSIFGKDEISSIEELKKCYYTLEKGYNSMAVNVPGTLYYKSMKARKQLGQIVADLISSRRKSNAGAKDLLASFMESKEALTDDQISDNIIGVIFAARDTTASVLTWIVKYLGENPGILKAVTEEQEEVITSKEKSGEVKNLTWADTKKMPYTVRVIQETMRVASILSFTFREAVEDVEYEGYLIPKGWKVLPLFRNIHHSSDNFTDPEKFDPSRFEQSAVIKSEVEAMEDPKPGESDIAVVERWNRSRVVAYCRWLLQVACCLLPWCCRKLLPVAALLPAAASRFKILRNRVLIFFRPLVAPEGGLPYSTAYWALPNNRP